MLNTTLRYTNAIPSLNIRYINTYFGKRKHSEDIADVLTKVLKVKQITLPEMLNFIEFHILYKYNIDDTLAILVKDEEFNSR